MEERNNENLSKEIDIRTKKINDLKAMGINPFAPKFDETHSIKQACLLKEGDNTSCAGRVVFRRTFGKFMFLQIADIYGKIQVSLSVDQIAEKDFQFFKDYVDIGDYVGFSGTMYHTKTGELTIQTEKFSLLSKAKRSLPEKYHGLTDIDLKYRQRYLDLITNQETQETFVKRAKILGFIRKFLIENDFMEVETPILQTVASGAAAKPFVTKHNALDKTYFLRIAPEIFLKQVVAGGIPRVFEIGKNFRNEGMDAQHLQEFTMLEWYASYWDYNKNIDFITKLLQEMVLHVNGNYIVNYQGTELNFEKFDKLDYIKSLNDVLNLNILDYSDVEELKKEVLKLNIFDEKEIMEINNLGVLFDYMYKRTIRTKVVQPTIVYNYPNLVPLARPSDTNPDTIEMFQVLVAGAEISKAYSELVDPDVQRAGFEQQMKNKEMGDEEAFELDEEFLLAMEHGMPPMSGLGLGIDRVVCLLTNQPTLRDVVLFPNMK